MGRRMTTPSALAGVLIGAGILGIPVVRPAASVPSVPELAALKAELSRASAVRVTTASGAYVLRDVRLDSSGVSSARWGPGAATRPALITTPDALPAPTPPPIPWSGIARIETGRTNAGRFALIGVMLGVAAGTVVWRTIPLGADGARGSAPVVVGVPAAAGLVLGAFLGSQQHRWSAIYPGRTSPGPAREAGP